MKRMSLILASLFAMFTFTGCIATNANNEVVGLKGIVSGATYKFSSLVHVYEVLTFGVKTLMTKDQIQKAGLDKANSIIRYAYSYVADEQGNINEGNKVEVEELKGTTIDIESIETETTITQ